MTIDEYKSQVLDVFNDVVAEDNFFSRDKEDVKRNVLEENTRRVLYFHPDLLDFVPHIRNLFTFELHNDGKEIYYRILLRPSENKENVVLRYHGVLKNTILADLQEAFQSSGRTYKFNGLSDTLWIHKDGRETLRGNYMVYKAVLYSGGETRDIDAATEAIRAGFGDCSVDTRHMVEALCCHERETIAGLPVECS